MGFRTTYRTSRSKTAHTWTEELELDGLPVRITYKSIKNMHMRVSRADGHVEISAPHGVSRNLIEEFVTKKRPWIEAQMQKQASTPRAIAEQASPEQQAEWKAVVSSCVPLLIAKWEPILQVKAGKIAYRNMKSRWGSCQPSTGRICINTRLALYPPDCLEYVVVHELCHLRERGHTPRFWELVGTCLPHWRQSRDKLRS